ncbi:MAG: helix-turn-helix domain-containing protein [Solirubrobacteraceae bacterium]
MRSHPPMPPQRRSTPRSPAHAALGQAIELLIAEDAQMTQETVAAAGGLTNKQVGALVRGQGNPTYSTLMKVCQGLHVRIDQLLVLAMELQDKSPGR